MQSGHTFWHSVAVACILCACHSVAAIKCCHNVSPQAILCCLLCILGPISPAHMTGCRTGACWGLICGDGCRKLPILGPRARTVAARAAAECCHDVSPQTFLCCLLCIPGAMSAAHLTGCRTGACEGLICRDGCQKLPVIEHRVHAVAARAAAECCLDVSPQTICCNLLCILSFSLKM